MHWPAPMTKNVEGPDRSIDWIDTWKSMEKLYKENPNKLKAIGRLNLTILRWRRLLNHFMRRCFQFLGRVPGETPQGRHRCSCCQSDWVAPVSYFATWPLIKLLLTNYLITDLALSKTLYTIALARASYLLLILLLALTTRPSWPTRLLRNWLKSTRCNLRIFSFRCKPTNPI